MKSYFSRGIGAVVVLLAISGSIWAEPELAHPALKLRRILAAGHESNPVRLAQDPRNAQLHSVVSIPARAFKLQGEHGRSYRVEFSNDLTVWESLITLPPESGELNFFDPTEIVSGRFYRSVTL